MTQIEILPTVRKRASLGELSREYFLFQLEKIRFLWVQWKTKGSDKSFSLHCRLRSQQGVAHLCFLETTQYAKIDPRLPLLAPGRRTTDTDLFIILEYFYPSSWALGHEGHFFFLVHHTINLILPPKFFFPLKEGKHKFSKLTLIIIIIELE